MAIERIWNSVPIRVFTQNGQSNGYVVVESTAGFKVKQSVVINALNLPTLRLEVKRVLSPTIMILGEVGKSITDRHDMSQYTVNLAPTIYAEEQSKNKVPKDDQRDATYAREPIVARRVHNVDEFGNPYNKKNGLPIQESGHVAVDTAVLTHLQTLAALGIPLPVGTIISTENDLIVLSDGTLIE